jgi:uncharacterized membrane protein YhaH (DUF805 family)
MDARLRRKPLWRWELFLFAVVLVAAMAASLALRPDWPIIGPVISIVLLVVAVAAALALMVPLLRRTGRDSENSRHGVDGVELVPLAPLWSVPTTVRVVESERRQTSIEAAVAKSGTVRAVLTPDASRWLGRELRVAVDLVDDDGGVHRAGFVPRDLDARVDDAVRPLVQRGAAPLVPVTVTASGRPFTVEIRL